MKWANPARSSFQARVLLPVLGFLVLVPFLTLWVVHHRGTVQFERQTVRNLLSAETLFERHMAIRRRALLSEYRNIAEAAALKAIASKLEIARSESEHPSAENRESWARTMKTHVVKVREELTAAGSNPEVILYSMADGTLLENSPAPGSPLRIRDLHTAAEEIIHDALLGQSKINNLIVNGELLDVISVPVIVNENPVGALTAVVRITDSVAREIGDLTRSDILFVGHGQIVASTLKDHGAQRSLPADLLNVTAPNARSVKINDDHYKAIAGALDRHDSKATGIGYILLSSYEESLQELQATQATLWTISFTALLGSALGVWITIGRATEPLRRLRNKAEAVGRGDFSKQLEVDREDELGALARSFNDMTINLQTSRAQLEKTVDTLKTTQNQLVQREKLSAVGEFVAGVAHELNNPLTSLIGFAELLQGGGVSEKQAGYLNYIVKSSQRCHKIVQNLLSFARQHPPERNIVHISELIDSVVELLAYEMRTGNVEVLTRYDSTSPPIMGDFHQLQQVVLNILNNARHALEGTQAHGRIRIVTERAGELIRILISDNGPGISAENLSKIFDPFFTTKPVGKGTGLGLSLCYGIIKEHGGSIQANSQPGAGATFIIDLPAAREQDIKLPRDNKIADDDDAAHSNGKRILVIDDEDWILTLTRKILEEDGFEVDVASNGETALSAVAKTQYDLLVCDQKMPGLSGSQLYRKLVVDHPATAERLIFMTGDVVGDNFQQFLKETRKTCLTKPFSLKQLRATVAEAIRNR